MELEQLVQYRADNPNELTKEKLDALEQEIRHPREKVLSDEYLDFKLWCRGYPSRQEAFAEYVEQGLKVERSSSVMEVGGGRTGRLSRILAGKGYHMTCMDPKLEGDGAYRLSELGDGEYGLSEQRDGAYGSLVQRDGEPGSVRFVREAFDYRSTSLAGYDWVIAQEPCDATEHIIRACLEQGVPFFVALCGVPHRLISGEMPGDVWEWYEYLHHIDAERTGYEILKLYGMARVAVIYSCGNAPESLVNPL
ncbi:MAG: hypothetical protein Q4F28_14570 [Eubacteriales bacterium]|nr:hypothetical protein [Eubacteriales bacterium]